MNLWHDDIRKAPPGWEWVRTNDEAVSWIKERGLPDRMSLDHDLGLDHLDPDKYENPEVFRGASPDGSGLDFVKWLCDNFNAASLQKVDIVVHSWSPGGAYRMVQWFNDHGVTALAEQYSRAYFARVSR